MDVGRTSLELNLFYMKTLLFNGFGKKRTKRQRKRRRPVKQLVEVLQQEELNVEIEEKALVEALQQEELNVEIEEKALVLEKVNKYCNK
ncbi:hypothetical protein Bpfe_003764 [Biomphalaria pfeifferi]|uniref:Uncharacterized protein n=1 Tax=Biomphalaria pfeifferi TaxID=112525 RepID=A0AAD8C7K8_BIOPF|nr:hypothetical protein Bpfe_003764 [Biomphalaria pfeifferi]